MRLRCDIINPHEPTAESSVLRLKLLDAAFDRLKRLFEFPLGKPRRDMRLAVPVKGYELEDEGSLGPTTVGRHREAFGEVRVCGQISHLGMRVDLQSGSPPVIHFAVCARTFCASDSSPVTAASRSVFVHATDGI